MRGLVAKTTMVLVACLLCCGKAAAAEGRPVAVSPGASSKITLVEVRCPTFSWGAVAGASSYDLVVFRVSDDTEAAKPALEQSLPGTASSWTPALDRCLERGLRYAWSVRAVVGSATSEWSVPSFFRVAPRLSEAEFEEALQIVRSHLGTIAKTTPRGTSKQSAATRTVQAPTQARRAAAAAAPVPLAPPANTKLSVDGNVDAVSFSGNGSLLTSVNAASVNGNSCVGIRWVDQGDGTVFDCNSRKIWLKDASCLGTGTWDVAAGAGSVQEKVADFNNTGIGSSFGCADYTEGAHTDWRVPSISELCSAGANLGVCPIGAYATSIVDTRFSGSPTVSNSNGDGTWIAGDPFVGVLSTCYWSATSYSSTQAMSVSLASGSVSGTFKTTACHVWPVRYGP